MSGRIPVFPGVIRAALIYSFIVIPAKAGSQ